MNFHRAPVACRARGLHIYIEGQISSLEDESLIEEAVSRFGHHLTRDPITAHQWLQAIKRDGNGDQGSDLDKDVVDAIARVMLAERFKGESHPARQTRVTAALQDLTRLGGGAHIQLENPQGLDAAALAALLDVPEGDALSILDERSLAARIQSLLAVSPLGQQAFSPEQGEDEEAIFALMGLLMKNHGYSSMVAQRSPGQTWCDRLQPPRATELFDALGPEQAVAEFFQTLVRSGWDGSGSVYMSRIAPAFNPLAAIRPFESLVHHKIIGWRLPQELVDRQTLAARAVVSREGEQQSASRRRALAEA